MKDEKYFTTKIQNTIENLEQTQENLETDMFAIKKFCIRPNRFIYEYISL